MTQLSGRARRGVAFGLAASSTAAIFATIPATASATPSATSVCGDIAHCKVIKQVDVDGDHHKDTVAIVPKTFRRGLPTAVTVRVRLANGKLAKATVKNIGVSSADDIFRGAARLDGRRGAELMITRATGAHGMSYRVLTFRAGGLEALIPPKADANLNRIDWFTDSALMSETGVFRSKQQGHPAKIKIKTAAYSEHTKRMQGKVVSYRWTDGAWHHISTVKKSWAQEHSAFGGWHLKGLTGV